MSEWKVILLSHGWTVEDESPDEVILKKGKATAYCGSYGVHIGTTEVVSNAAGKQPVLRLLEWSPNVHSRYLLEWIAAEKFE